MLVVVGGVTGAALLAAGGAVILGAGVATGAKAVEGIVHRNFAWKDWAISGMTEVALTLITFGAGYGAALGAGLAI